MLFKVALAPAGQDPAKVGKLSTLDVINTKLTAKAANMCFIIIVVDLSIESSKIYSLCAVAVVVVIVVHSQRVRRNVFVENESLAALVFKNYRREREGKSRQTR
jgi:hypothetical protein